MPTLMLAQTPVPSSAPSAAMLFYITLLVIFVTAIVTTLATKWARDKCLKLFNHSHVTMERARGQCLWGALKVFSAGVEVVYDHSFVDPRGRKKTSYMIYAPEIDQHLLALLRYHHEMNDEQKRARDKQIRATFNPGPLRRFWRQVRNVVNTLKDAFNAAFGAAVSQYQRINPAGAIISQQAGSVTQLGQTLIGRFAANAYEPLLEQYIGRAVILDVADPINPNNATTEYTGYLADYTQQFIAVFNVEHQRGELLTITLPDVAEGAPLPPLPPPAPPGAPAPVLPPPAKMESDLAVRIDGLRFKVQNLRHEPVAVVKLEREGYEPVTMGMVLPSMATLDLPARDARGAKLTVQVVRCLDVIAPRRLATVRHAGELVERRGLMDELNLQQLPLLPGLFHSAAKPPADTTDELD